MSKQPEFNPARLNLLLFNFHKGGSMLQNGKPKVRTALPGPQGEPVVARNQRTVTPSLPKAYPLVIDRASGAIVHDVDGNVFLDFAAGVAVNATGHCHPKIVRAIQDQAAKLLHICGADFFDPQYIDLSERLALMAPMPGPNKVFLGNSGAEAVEAAIKLARYHSKRANLVAFYGAFHGRTMGAVSLTASKPVYHRGFGPLLSGVHHVPYGYCYRCPLNLKYPSCNIACIDNIEDTLFTRTVPGDEVAAIFVEPVQGEGGYIVPPDGWMQKLRALCDRWGILLVADEVQSGIGRTGKMFAIEHWDVQPDIVTLAKAIASGLPLSAMIAREEVMTWPAGAHGSTMGGNPVSCAAAQATLDVIEEEHLLANAVTMGARLSGRLRELQATSRLIGDVRGLGLMIGIELVRDKETKERAKAETDALMLECFQRGLLLLPCGSSSMRFSPPLTITAEEADTAFSIFAEALQVVEGMSETTLQELVPAH
jgi:4-aminobutyrate aminotransferase